MEPDIEVSRDIAAAPAAVFAAITDVTRMGEWSPETFAAAWKDGFDHAELGAVFVGQNQANGNEWTTEATIVDLVENERFFFDCSVNDFVFAKWGYVIEATDRGCTVTEYSQNLIPEQFREQSAAISGVTDRDTHNRAGMEVTLERLAAAVESA
jgi:uncharacterized protein YndB with AHSA1/START domain